ncbi:MAG: hypothetical protein U9R48_04160, partial [Chloroflexota bacterium]|nr:hypothetical protein [Chloroflexota bacterium]
DVNASGVVASWLAERGHNVARVADRDPKMPDQEVLRWPIREKRPGMDRTSLVDKLRRWSA